MAKTMVDLTRRVLEKLTVIGEDDPVPAGSSDLVQRVYQARLQEAELRGVAAFNYDAIPDAYVEALAHWIAACCAIDFGQTYDDSEAALRQLRRVTAKPYIGTPAQINYL